jgi:hypothetical protein
VGQGGRGQAIFTVTLGKQLTREGLNAALKTLVSPIFNFKEGSISCHSFRAALSSALAAPPSEISAKDIKNWGRWKREAYRGYTCLKHQQKKELYEKITESLILSYK